MNRISVLQFANITAFIITLIFNFLSQSASVLGLELFPYTVAELGEARGVFFLPAGYVFAIWGVIYLGLAAYVIYQGRPSMREDSIQERIGWWFVASSIGNVTWLVLFVNNRIYLSTVAIVLILVSLLAIYLRLDIGRRQVSRAEFWVVHIPFSIYLGWVSVATIANIAAALYDAGNMTALLGIGADVWTAIMMVIAAVLALAMIFTRRDVAFPLVVVWALVGIYARPFNTAVFEPVADLDIDLVNTTALVLAVVIAAAVIAFLFLRWQGASRQVARQT